jgi:hypothetical protein
MIDFASRVVVPEQVLVRQLDDEIVILDLESESYFGLDEMGTAMWNELTAANSIEQAYKTLLNQYDVEPEVLRSDVQNLVQQLVEQKLLELHVGQN